MKESGAERLNKVEGRRRCRKKGEERTMWNMLGTNEEEKAGQGTFESVPNEMYRWLKEMC